MAVLRNFAWRKIYLKDDLLKERHYWMWPLDLDYDVIFLNLIEQRRANGELSKAVIDRLKLN